MLDGVDDAADLDPELIRFLREELGHEVPVAGGPLPFTGPVWVWKPKSGEGKSSTQWHFLTITGEAAARIRAAAPGRSAAWGSVYVSVQLGGTRWQTSVFPSKDAGGFLLPLKAAVRKKEGVSEGDVVSVVLTL